MAIHLKYTIHSYPNNGNPNWPTYTLYLTNDTTQPSTISCCM
jgi:hypothetical protein